MNSPQDPSSSSTPKVVALRGIARISARASGILSMIYGHTGRYVTFGSHDDTVRNWIKCTDDTSLRAHAGCEQFVQELRRVQIILEPLQCYRGRTPPFRSEVPNAEEMGPPSHAEAGRYNRGGIGVLYMSEREMGVQRELRAKLSSGPFWVQRFVIPSQARGIADLTMVDRESVINSACSVAEHAAPDGEATFAFSQFIAALVADRFDGMRVPGVRGTSAAQYTGTSAAQYTNVVMFSPERWRDWIDPSTGPTRLALDESDA